MLCFSALALNWLISKLDKRLENTEPTKHGFKKKERIIKSPSKLGPPANSPSWAVVTETPSSSHQGPTNETPTSSRQGPSTREAPARAHQGPSTRETPSGSHQQSTGWRRLNLHPLLSSSDEADCSNKETDSDSFI